METGRGKQSHFSASELFMSRKKTMKCLEIIHYNSEGLFFNWRVVRRDKPLFIAKDGETGHTVSFLNSKLCRVTLDVALTSLYINFPVCEDVH